MVAAFGKVRAILSILCSPRIFARCLRGPAMLVS